MSQGKFDLEAVYDSEIAPLMTKIIEICKAHKLPMFATFLFANDPDGEDGLCTTNLMFKERPIPHELLQLEPSIRHSSLGMKLTIRDKDGKITEQTVII